MSCGSSKTSPNSDDSDIEANQLKVQLKKAIEGNDLDQLKKAINEFEKAKIDDKDGDIPTARKRLQELRKNIKVLDSEPGYPEAKPPTTKKKNIFDEKKYKEIDEKSSKIKVTPELTYEELLTTLTKDLKSDLEKLRAIFYFVGRQDIEKQYYPGVTDPHTPRGYMKLIKLKEGHYQGFFALLCRAANLPCMILNGQVKSVAYEVGDEEIRHSSWNAVYVDGQWRLVHPHWAFTGISGYNSGRWMKIEEKGEQKREQAKATKGIQVSGIEEYWFMPDPDQFVYFCIADSPNWQLLEEPWTKKKFLDVPYFQYPYFTKSEMTLSSSHKAVLTSEEGMVEITFDHDDSCKSDITYALFFDVKESKGKLPNNKDLPRCVFFESTEKMKRLIYHFHVVGVYKTMIFCGGTAEIVSFKIECTEVSSNPNLFPPNPPIGYGYSHIAKENGLLAPSEIGGVVQTDKNKAIEFHFQLDREQNLEAQLCHNDFTPQELPKYIKQETEDDRVHFTVAVPEHLNKGDFALQISTVKENKKSNVVNYLLTDRKDDFVSETENKRKRLIRELKKATEGDDPDRLEKAMDQFEKAKINDMDGDLPKARKRLQELRKNNQLKVQLKKAIEENDPDQLEKAIDEFEKAKIDDKDSDIPIARKRLQELSKNNQLMVQLNKAIEGDSPDRREEAMDQFEKAEINDIDCNLPIARKRLQELRKNNQLMVQLKKAIEGDNPDRLEKAVDQFDKSKINDMDRDLPKARKRLQELRKNNRLMVQLKKAIDGDDLCRLVKAMDQFEKLKINDRDGDLPKARKRLQELRKNNQLKMQLKKAIEGNDLDHLVKALDEFEKANIDDMDCDIPIARKRLQELKKNNRLMVQLKKALDGDDLYRLVKAMDQFEKSKINDRNGDLPKARKRLQELRKNKNVKHTLKKAMKERNVRELEAAIDECESAGIPCGDSDLVAAKERLRDMQDNSELIHDIVVYCNPNNADKKL